MNYQTYQPHPDLSPFVKCYWILEVPADGESERQRILPDGCIEMIVVLGDDVKRYTSGDDFIIQPRAMVLGQITEPFFVEPTGQVNSFAVRFYPYGFTSFVNVPLVNLANKETPIEELFEEEKIKVVVQEIENAADTNQRIEIIEAFLLGVLKSETTIDYIVKTTVDVLLASGGSTPIKAILTDDLSKRRQLERNFLKQVGMSPKQLGKVVRLQTALKMLLTNQSGSLTQIAYESEYYDQAHFSKDFREFTGINPKEFLEDSQMQLSSLFYSGE
jgi:hypothetical protein